MEVIFVVGILCFADPPHPCDRYFTGYLVVITIHLRINIIGSATTFYSFSGNWCVRYLYAGYAISTLSAPSLGCALFKPKAF